MEDTLREEKGSGIRSFTTLSEIRGVALANGGADETKEHWCQQTSACFLLLLEEILKNVNTPLTFSTVFYLLFLCNFLFILFTFYFGVAQVCFWFERNFNGVAKLRQDARLSSDGLPLSAECGTRSKVLRSHGRTIASFKCAHPPHM